jgi:hypothetical protein
MPDLGMVCRKGTALESLDGSNGSYANTLI